MTPSKLTAHEKKVKDAKAEYEQIAGLCRVAAEEEKLKAAQNLLDDLKLTWLEGLLVHGFSSDVKPVALKGKAHGFEEGCGL